MAGLRERQKEDRRNRILRAAHRLFTNQGYERATVEAIAEAAQVSGVTVHNYYGTKANVLLALVTDSDAKLVARLESELSAGGAGAKPVGAAAAGQAATPWQAGAASARPQRQHAPAPGMAGAQAAPSPEVRSTAAPDDLRGLVLHFAAVVRDHALSHLDKALWRQVIAASVIEAGSPFGRAYHALDHQLALTLVRAIERLQASGAVAPQISALDLGKALFHVQNTRFIQFISVPEMTDAQADAKLRADLDALLAV